MAEFNPKHVLFVIFLLLQVTQALADNEEDADGKPLKYRQQWVVTINGTRHEINKIAQELNLRVRTIVGDRYVLQKEGASADTTLKDDKLTGRLSKNPIVITAKQMVITTRIPRDDEYGYEASRNRMKRDLQFNDPMWNEQWYMNDNVNFSETNINLNVEKAWDMGFTGKGVVVAVVDDGVEWTHDDLKNNYNSKYSIDITDDDNDPSPAFGYRNSHGTNSAGLIAMEKNNNKCGVGVAHDCTLGAIRLLGHSNVTDADESIALSYKINEIDIYSNSWGPEDDGRTLEGPGELTAAALTKGVNEGRSGKGVLYVWASGDGGVNDDDCNCDGYASSIYTTSISYVTHSGRITKTVEYCSNTLAAVYSRSRKTGKELVTVSLNNTCSTDVGGTFAACPIASGIYALVLQANPNITWRDVQHLTVWTSSYEAVRNNCGWHRNARGFLFHERIGFGLMNAHKMVKTALNWVNVDNQHICEVNPTTRNGEMVPLESSNSTTITAFIFETDGCKSQTDSQISYLEHVVVQATIESEYRGGLMIILTSPSGTATTLLNARWKDSSTSGFRDWKFITVQLWGENPSGEWELSVVDMNLHAIFGNGTIGKGKVKNMKLILYGTSTIPKYLEHGPRRYKDENDVADLLNTTCSKS